MISVIVVDDETKIAHSIADGLALEEDIDVVGIGADGAEAVALTRRFMPDVVLLDLNMPIMHGLQALQQIKTYAPSTEVLILTVQDDDIHLFTALQYGAKGYLLKEATLEAITVAVREVARGVAAIPPALAARVLAEFQRLANQAPAIRDLYSVLTRQEIEVLKLIGNGNPNRQIAEILSVERSTLKKHITNIRHKLEVNSRTEAILIARESGLSAT